jgi:hypothetical protein
MAINQNAQQDKLGRKLDRGMFKKPKHIPLMERRFDELLTLEEQFEWLKNKRREKDKQNNK